MLFLRRIFLHIADGSFFVSFAWYMNFICAIAEIPLIRSHCHILTMARANVWQKKKRY